MITKSLVDYYRDDSGVYSGVDDDDRDMCWSWWWQWLVVLLIYVLIYYVIWQNFHLSTFVYFCLFLHLYYLIIITNLWIYYFDLFWFIYNFFFSFPQEHSSSVFITLYLRLVGGKFIYKFYLAYFFIDNIYLVGWLVS